jgi:hypothetical protein
MTAVVTSGDRADGGGELGSESAPAQHKQKKQKTAAKKSEKTNVASEAVFAPRAARRAAHAKVLRMYTGLNQEEAVARAALAEVEERTSNKRAEPEQSTDESGSDEVVVPLDEVVLLVTGEDLAAEDDTSGSSNPTMEDGMEDGSDEDTSMCADDSPTGDWEDVDAEPSSPSSTPGSESDDDADLSYVRVKQHNVVAYVPHADTATCEVNDVELDEATTRWKFGDEVEGLYTFADGGKRRWFFAVVQAVMDAGDTYTLTYEYVPDTSMLQSRI